MNYSQAREWRGTVSPHIHTQRGWKAVSTKGRASLPDDCLTSTYNLHLWSVEYTGWPPNPSEIWNFPMPEIKRTVTGLPLIDVICKPRPASEEKVKQEQSPECYFYKDKKRNQILYRICTDVPLWDRLTLGNRRENINIKFIFSMRLDNILHLWKDNLLR